MKKFNLKIAGFIIRINFYPTEKKYLANLLIRNIVNIYKGFILSGQITKIDFIIDFINKKHHTIQLNNNHTKKFIEFFENNGEHKITTSYIISLAQFEIIIRSILLKLLARKNGFILHASSVCIDNQAYIFTGQSGIGKSTIIKLLRKKYKILADDSVIIKKDNEKYYLYQTPFIEKESWIIKDSKKYMIDRIFILKQSKSCRIFGPLKIVDSIDKIVEQLFTESKNIKKHGQNLIKYIKNTHGWYELYFLKDTNKLITCLQNSI